MPSTGIGALIGLGLGAYGQKPVVPNLTPIDPNQVQAQTIAGNQQNFGAASQLAAGVNTFNQEQLNSLIDKALGPGTRESIQRNIGQLSAGQVPADVQEAIQRSTASQAVAGGFGGSNFGRNLTARDLGLTSLNLIQQGMSSAESWLQRAQAPLMDASSMFFTPQQRLGFAQQQQSAQFQRDLMAAGVAAAPDPGMAALAQGFDSDISKLENAALSYGGMAAGASMGAPQTTPPPSSASSPFGYMGALGGFASNNQSFGTANPYNLGGYNYFNPTG